MEDPALPLVGLLLAALGVRIVLHARSGTFPELAVGIWFVGIGIGLPIMHRASIPGGVPSELAPALIAFAQLLLALAFSGLFGFSCRTYGPDCAWRRGLAVLGVCACLASWLGIGWFEGFGPRGGVATLALALVRVAGVVWAFLETGRYALRMRRRARIGLADPVVANRFALWSVWMGILLLGMGVAVGVRWAQIELSAGRQLIDVEVIVSVTRVAFAVFGGVAATTMWLSFFPPQRYERWLREGSLAAVA